MWTQRYNGAWIHGYCDRDECRIQFGEPGTYTFRTAKSLHAAKCIITRTNNGS